MSGEFGRETTMIEGIKASLMLDPLDSGVAVALLHFRWCWIHYLYDINFSLCVLDIANQI